jgi:TrmH RNA methyltransferase
MCGLNACRARFERRPETIIRAYVSEVRMAVAGPLLSYLAAQRRTYHIVADDVLEKVASSKHHEGIVLLVREVPPCTVHDFCRASGIFAAPMAVQEPLAKSSNIQDQQEAVPEGAILILDGVANPHNLGAIVRTAAHFGVKGIFALSGVSASTLFTPSFYRTAAGGAEGGMVFGAATPNEARELVAGLVAQGWDVVGTTSQQSIEQREPAKAAPLPKLRAGQPGRGRPNQPAAKRAETPEAPKYRASAASRAPVSIYEARFAPRTVFVVGAESSGLSPEMMSLLDTWVAVPGSGFVESLNVACAASVLLGEFGPLSASGFDARLYLSTRGRLCCRSLVG